MELLSPAGSYEAAVAAVQNGADAVYLGYGAFNARRNAANFDENSLRTAVDYCHLRGVKVYLTLNTLLSDHELPQAARYAAEASRIGVDAVLVQDLGVAELVRSVAPGLPLHASTQMTVHSLDGVLACAALGMERVVLSRELTRQQIAHICRHAPIEVEVFVHGALCMCYSGQCFFSSLIGTRSGNRGLCAQPCRMQYGWSGSADGYPLSLKDMSLVHHLAELEDMGVACAKIEGRMKRPEYVAIVTRIYAAALRECRAPTAEELEQLRAAFSRQGFTDGYYTGKTGRQMFGVREAERTPEKLFAQVRQDYHREHPRVGIRLAATMRAGAPLHLAAEDPEGRTLSLEGPVPQTAIRRPTTREEIARQLEKTGGTPYYVQSLEVEADAGLAVPLSALNGLRRRLLDELSVARIQPPERPEGQMPDLPRTENRAEAPVYTLSLRRAGQLTEALLNLKPAVIYLAPEEILAARPLVERAIADGVEVCAALPRVLWDSERPALERQLDEVRALGVTSALVGELGTLAWALQRDFTCRGDFGLGVYNSLTLAQLREMGLRSATLSFEQRLARVRDLAKPLDTELIVYGRLPLMITQNCIIKNRSGRCACQGSNQLTDRTGAQFPVLPAYGCRNEIFNSKKLYLGDKTEQFARIGLWAARLSFTTENPRECVRVFERYLGRGSYAPVDYTRGLYFRDVE
ncbi:MAG TPA: U32 family peptidase [Candidatus Onthomonas avicola]|nr:U32 family peptidase [Candidatus Onthomonas avicola]